MSLPEASTATGPLITLHRLKFTGLASGARRGLVVVQVLALHAGPASKVAFDFGRVASKKTTAQG
ncbi:hypothetical protein, partial [Mesorhizobium sp. M7A.F.Ca.US.001.04.2.1]|uniref:hypothetical protein n=1 Tax=Mesorhizobium sp. M7A.F.Ca.US.001.04.2.1 TaxID=2496727 RepID=UPI0019D24C86